MSRSVWPSVLLIGTVLGLRALPVAGADPEPPAKPAPKPPDAQAQTVKKEAEELITKASAAADTAINWLSEHGATLKTKSQSWRTDAEATLRHAVEDALSYPPAPTGLFSPVAAAPDEPPRWVPIDQGPPPDARVVLLVHGLDEPGTVWDDLAPALHAAGLGMIRFDYPNDEPIAQSADALALALRDLRSRGVKRVDIVGHSMGAIIARDVLTRPADYASRAIGHKDLPDVPVFIMAAPPNKGSQLARVRFLSEAREQLVRWWDAEHKDPRALLGFLKDGAGEAGTDLLPDSPYLSDLNSRPLPTDVRMTILVGVLGSGVEQDLRDALEWEPVRSALGAVRVAQLEEVIHTLDGVLGDGVVTVDSAHLDGVTDVVLVDATHRTMLKRPAIEKALREAAGEPQRVPSALPVILDRLQRDSAGR